MGIVVMEVCEVGDSEVRRVLEWVCTGSQGLDQEELWPVYKGVEILFCHKYKITLKIFEIVNDIRIFMLGKIN